MIGRSQVLLSSSTVTHRPVKPVLTLHNLLLARACALHDSSHYRCAPPRILCFRASSTERKQSSRMRDTRPSSSTCTWPQLVLLSLNKPRAAPLLPLYSGEIAQSFRPDFCTFKFRKVSAAMDCKQTDFIPASSANQNCKSPQNARLIE